MKKIIFKYFEELGTILKMEKRNINSIEAAIDILHETFKNNKKVLICGNGGSAADSQHFSAELVGRFKLRRKSYDAISLTTDTSTITSIGNDFGFDKIFSRQIEGIGKKDDVLVAFSTSGNSKNIVEAIKKAKEKEIYVISFTGNDGGSIKEISDLNINVSSNNTPRIQEIHGFYIHIICELLEKKIEK